ncbi:Ig-like domain-containing protein, partial [Pantoea sp.]|uniref:Ig-like domain-containing protein n=1 Tax=Pantoea sp. TaxID=69393 RepID=UPI0031CECC93
MTNAISILTVEGKTIVNTANLPTQAAGKAVHIKAVHAGKYLLVADQHQTAPQQIVVKRVGKDLLIFTQQGDETPEVVIDGFYDNQGELVGMSSDGSYHTYVESNSNREAFLMLTDGGSDTLVMSSQQATGLSGLAVANSGISNTALAFGIAGGALAAIGALVAAGGGGSGGGSKNDQPQQQPVSGDAGAIPAPQPTVPYNNVAIDDRGDVLAPIASGSLTNDNQPLLSGKGTPGSNVRVYDNGQLIGSAVVDDNGQWQFKPATALSDASHELSFSEVNSDGVESAQSAPIRFDIDTQPPAAPADVTITDGNGQDLSAGGLSDANPLHFAGTGEPGDTALIYDGDKVIGSAVVGADGQWSADITLPGDGDHSLSVGFTDPAGNSGATTKPVIVDYDITPPAVPADVAIVDDKGSDLSQGGATNTNPLHLGGTGEPGDTAIIYDGDKPVGSAIVGADGKWSADITLPDQGEHAIGVGMKDPAGNESNKSTPVIVDFDTVAPDAPVVGDLKDGNGADLSAGGLTNNGSVEMSGSDGTEGDIVKLYDGDKLIGSTTVGADGSWSIPADISGDDEHSLSASFTDPAGNESPKSTPVIVDLDTTPPNAPVIGDVTDGNGADLSTGGLTNNGSVEMSGSGGTEGDIVKLYDGTTLIGSTTVGADGSWTIPADISGDDEHSLSASFTDPAGNESPKSTPVIVDLD